MRRVLPVLLALVAAVTPGCSRTAGPGPPAEHVVPVAGALPAAAQEQGPPPAPPRFDHSGAANTLAWFKWVTRDFHDATADQARRDRANARIESLLARCAGHEVTWEFRVRAVGDRAAPGQPPTCEAVVHPLRDPDHDDARLWELFHTRRPTAGTLPVYELHPVCSDSVPRGDPRPSGNFSGFALPKDDWVAALKAGDRVWLRGTIRSVEFSPAAAVAGVDPDRFVSHPSYTYRVTLGHCQVLPHPQE